MSEWDKPEKGFKKFESATIQMLFFDKWKSALCKVALLIQWVQEMVFLKSCSLRKYLLSHRVGILCGLVQLFKVVKMEGTDPNPKMANNWMNPIQIWK